MPRRANNHTASPPMSATTAAAMVTSPPSLPRQPPSSDTAGAWGPYASPRAFFSNVATILIILACVSLLAFALHAAARLLMRCLARRRAERGAQAPNKAPSDAAASFKGGSDGAAATAGAWAEAECAICLSELVADGERVRVLPVCGHGFHGACVEGWLAARASCPTCRAPSPAGEP